MANAFILMYNAWLGPRPLARIVACFMIVALIPASYIYYWFVPKLIIEGLLAFFPQWTNYYRSAKECI